MLHNGYDSFTKSVRAACIRPRPDDRPCRKNVLQLPKAGRGVYIALYLDPNSRNQQPGILSTIAVTIGTVNQHLSDNSSCLVNGHTMVDDFTIVIVTCTLSCYCSKHHRGDGEANTLLPQGSSISGGQSLLPTAATDVPPSGRHFIPMDAFS